MTAATALVIVLAQASAAARPLRIGVTLHPYYSWTANVVAGVPGVEVVPVLPGDVDAGSYQPSPADIAKLATLDALVVNGVGHDAFIDGMVRASGNVKLKVIRPNDGTPLLRAKNAGEVNAHTFISLTNAVQQTYAITRALSEMRPEDAARFQANAAAYAKRLRALKASAASKLAAATVTRVVTVHDGYGYLMQDMGIDVAAVVEPAHGLLPSANELQVLVDLCRKEKIAVVFAEATFPQAMLTVLKESAGVRPYVISHIATGPYTADRFEKEMEKNLATMAEALTAR